MACKPGSVPVSRWRLFI